MLRFPDEKNAGSSITSNYLRKLPKDDGCMQMKSTVTAEISRLMPNNVIKDVTKGKLFASTENFRHKA